MYDTPAENVKASIRVLISRAKSAQSKLGRSLEHHSTAELGFVNRRIECGVFLISNKIKLHRIRNVRSRDGSGL
jgi:hypothetical protein